KAREVSTGKYEGFSLAMTQDGRIVYLDSSADTNEIWIMKNDGTDRRQLTSDGALKTTLSVTPDGRYILFSSNRSGSYNIWRMDIDGNNQKQLTQESTYADRPVSSTDGKWVVYDSFNSGNWTIWKVAFDGGETVKISDQQCISPSISPDGKLVA